MLEKRVKENSDGTMANLRYRRRWKRLTSVLSVFVAAATLSALVLPAITLNQYKCGLEEHTHDGNCYTAGVVQSLSCNGEALGIHRHSASCYDAENQLTCLQADFVLHTHDGSCYDGDGALKCTLREVKEHRHEPGCYEPTYVEVEPGHTHVESCYTWARGEKLTCEKAEASAHEHGTGCYAAGTELRCTQEEYPAHTHVDACFQTENILSCGQAETPGHGHDESCRDENGELVCAQAEAQAHAHDANCCTQERKLTCQTQETPGHAHGPECYWEAGAVLCPLEAGPGHTHEETCYELVPGELLCTEQEREPVMEPGEPKCICSEQEIFPHSHKGTCYQYDDSGNRTDLVCGFLEVTAHQHSAACFTETTAQTQTCVKEEHTHTEDCVEVFQLTQEEQAQVDAVVAAIEKLPTLEAVNAQLAAYEEAGDAEGREAYLATLAEQVAPVYAQYGDLTEDQQSAVTNAPNLMALKWLLPEEETQPTEATLPTLTEEEQLLVDDLMEKIAALPTPEALTQELDACTQARDLTAWEAAVNAAASQAQTARSQYEALPEAVRLAVTNLQILTDLEALLADAVPPTLTEEEKAQTDALMAAIEALPERETVEAQLAAGEEDPLPDLKAQAEALRAEYDSLNDLQQRSITNLDKLAELEYTLALLSLTPEEQEEVSIVFSLIEGLPELQQTKEDFAALEAAGDQAALELYKEKILNAVLLAQEAYDALSDAQKALVTNAEKLLEYLAWLEETDLLQKTQHVATHYTDGTYTQECTDDPISVTLTAKLPRGAEVRSYPVAFSMGEDGPVLFARDITIFDQEGNVYQPEEPVTVHISGLEIPAHQELDVFHDLEDEYGGMERMAYTIHGDTVTFEASSFSTYAIVDAYTLNRIAEPGDPAAVQALIDSGFFTYWSQAAESGVQTASLPENSMATYAAGDNDPSDSQITTEGGSKTDGTVTVSKTIDGTDVENVFDITLTVDTTTNITELQKDPDMAVVIVMDISNTMNDAFSGSTRYKAAMEAAEHFLDEFAKANNGYSRIGYVAFNTDAHQIFGLSECSTTAQATTLKNTMRTGTGNIISASGYKDAHTRFTNVEAGLKLGQDMLANAPNDNKYIIFLSDGFPTTYIKSGYTGYDPYTSSGTPGTDGVFYDYLDKVHCDYGTSYSDKAAIRARKMAASIKNSGTKIFSIGIDVGGQTIDQYERDTYFSIIDRTSNSYEIGSSSDANAFKNWLRNSIGSGYYYDSTDTAGLQAAYDKIFAEIKSLTESANALKWIASDPMPLATTGGETIMEFIGFYDNKNALQVYEPIDKLVGGNTENGENTISFDGTKSAISWNLKQSGYTTTGSGNSTTYHYKAVYRVRLKNELDAFVEHQNYNTNGTTTLTYQNVTTVDGKETISGDKTIEFPIPAVKGYLGELKFKKVSSADKKPLQGAEFELRHDEKTCSLCRGDGKTYVDAVEKKVFTATSGENGIVTFEKIPSGHTYTLEETVVPNGYHTDGSTYSVKVAYDVVTVTETFVDKTTNLWDLTVTHELVNHTNPALPETGGVGTKLYTFSGGAMLIFAFALMYDCKRRQRKGAR